MTASRQCILAFASERSEPLHKHARAEPPATAPPRSRRQATSALQLRVIFGRISCVVRVQSLVQQFIVAGVDVLVWNGHCPGRLTPFSHSGEDRIGGAEEAQDLWGRLSCHNGISQRSTERVEAREEGKRGQPRNDDLQWGSGEEAGTEDRSTPFCSGLE